MKPAPPALTAPPLIGHALEFQRDRQGLFRRGYQTLGPAFSIKLGTKPAAVLIGPEYHQIYFAETDKKLSTHKTYAMLKAIFGETALAAPPEIYKEQRPVLYAPFKHERMVKYIPIMQLEVQAWIGTLGTSGEFELTAAFNSLVQNVAAHALMGKEFRDQVGAEFWKQYAILGKSLDPLLPPNLPLPKFIRRDRAKQRLREMVQPIIDERRAHPAGHDDFLQTFVDARYKDGHPVENELILNLILGLMFAGHETTAGQAAWTIIQVLQHPAYRRLVQAELTEKLPPGTIIDMNVLSSLDHVWWAVQETSRLHPSADIIIRLTEEDLDVGQYVIPKGWPVFISAGTAQRAPDLFQQPEEYDPLRFAPGRAEDAQHRFAMIGFGGGIHKCAGMNFANNEMMTIAALMFQQLDMELVTADPHALYGVGATRPSATIIRYRRR